MKLKLLFCLLLILGIVTPTHAQDPLTQTFSAPDGSLSFSHPDGWIVADVLGLFYAASNDPALLQTMQQSGDTDVVPSGSMVLAILKPAGNTLFGITADMPLTDIAATLRENNSDPTYGEARELTLGDYPALTFAANETGYEGAYIVLKIDTSIIITVAYSAPGEYAQAEPTILAILASLTVTPPIAGTLLQYTSPDTSLTFQYPADWYTLDVFGVTIIGNVTELFSEDPPPPGSVLMVIGGPSSAPFEDRVGLPLREVALRAFYDSFSEPESVGQVTELMLGSTPAARLNFTDDERDGMLLVFDLHGVYFTVTAQTPLGEFAEREAQFLAVAESLEYDPTKHQWPGLSQGALTMDTPTTANLGTETTHTWTFSPPPSEIIRLALTEEIPSGDFSQHVGTVYSPDGYRLTTLSTNQPTYLVLTDERPFTIAVENYTDTDRRDYTLTVHRVIPTTNLTRGETISGEKLADETLVYAFTGSAGDLLNLSVEGDLWGVSVIGPNNFSTDSNALVLPADGQYLVVLANGTGAYRMTLNTVEAQPIAPGDPLSANFDGNPHYFSLSVQSGTTLTFTATSDAFVPHLTLYTANGLSLWTARGFSATSQFTYTFPESGTYLLAVGTLYDLRTGPYSLTIE